jgi:hypothetical protein
VWNRNDNVAVPFSTLGNFWFGSGSRSGSGYGAGFIQYLAQFSNNKKVVQNLTFSLSEAALFARKLASHF